jgi:hypothetical protein
MLDARRPGRSMLDARRPWLARCSMLAGPGWLDALAGSMPWLARCPGWLDAAGRSMLDARRPWLARCRRPLDAAGRSMLDARRPWLAAPRKNAPGILRRGRGGPANFFAPLGRPHAQVSHAITGLAKNGSGS